MLYVGGFSNASCLRVTGTLGELRQANIVRSLVDRQRSSYALVGAPWSASKASAFHQVYLCAASYTNPRNVQYSATH